MTLPNDFRIDEKVVVQQRTNEDEPFRDIGSYDGIKEARNAIEESKLDGQFQMLRRSPVLAVGEVKRREATLVTAGQQGTAPSPVAKTGTAAPLPKKPAPAITRSSATA